MSYRSDFDFGNLGKVVLIIDTVAQNIAEGPQCTLQCIGCPFFLSFLECCRFALAVLDVTVANILKALVTCNAQKSSLLVTS